MKTPWKLARYLPMAARFLRDGRLPELLRALGDKQSPEGARFAGLKEDLRLLRSLCLAWFKGEYRQISSQALLMIVAALLYFIAPLDAIPDWLGSVLSMTWLYWPGSCVPGRASWRHSGPGVMHRARSNCA